MCLIIILISKKSNIKNKLNFIIFRIQYLTIVYVHLLTEVFNFLAVVNLLNFKNYKIL